MTKNQEVEQKDLVLQLDKYIKNFGLFFLLLKTETREKFHIKCQTKSVFLEI